MPRNPREWTGGDDRKQEEIHLKVPHPKIRRDARELRVFGSLIATHVRTSRKSCPCGPVRGSATHPSDCWDEERSGGSSDVSVSKERAHAIHPPSTQILSQLHVDMEMMSVTEDATEAQPDVEMGAESVRRGTTRTSSTWEDCADKINMEVCLDTAGECRRCDADVVLATVAGVRSEIHTDARVRSVQVALQIQKVIHGDGHQHENVPASFLSLFFALFYFFSYVQFFLVFLFFFVLFF